MATRSFIGIQNLDGSVDGIYCHHDGYLEGVGATLTAHYTTAEQVRELVALGSLSSLGEDLDVTQAYHRDRGDDLDIATYTKPSDIRFDHGNYAFVYLFRPTAEVGSTYSWHYADREVFGKGPEFKPLS
jgi:hypothetical protein